VQTEVTDLPTSEFTNFADITFRGQDRSLSAGLLFPKRNVTTLWLFTFRLSTNYQGADKSLARPTSRCILFDGENISFNASLVIYI
jgi:hypothetical protein